MILKKSIIGIVLSILSFQFLQAQGSYNQLMYDGNNSFNTKDYKEATSLFQQAAKQNPNDFAAHYNLGNSYYKSKRFEEAESEYAKAERLAKNKSDKTAALYNKGNALMKSNKQEEAASAYKKALQQDPFNENIKKNYQIAKLEQEEKQKKNQPQNQQNKDSDQDKKKSQDKDNKKGNNPKQQDGSGKNDLAQGKTKGKNQQQNKPKENDNMPKDLEQAILDRIDNKEKETARRVLNKNAYSIPESKEKDW